MLKILIRIWAVYFFGGYFLFGLTEAIKDIPWYVKWEPKEGKTKEDCPYKRVWVYKLIKENIDHFVEGLD